MRKILLAILFLSPVLIFAQPDLPAGFFKGYTKTVKGGGFQYHSPQPDVTSSLLLRSIDSVQYIEWETEMLPGDYTGKQVNFIWMFGIDANTDSHAFRLYVNDRYCLTFSNPLSSEMKPWRVEGRGGASLFFRTTLLDKYGDPMGYAVLNLPATMTERGKPQKIRVVGESKESRSWYMTFEAAVEEKLVVTQEPALVRGKDENFLPLLFQFVHLGDPVKGSIDVAGIPVARFTLLTGFNEVRMMLPESTQQGEHTALVKIGKQQPVTKNFTISDFRHFTIFLVQHAHTDIGYTRPQTEILPDHLRYIDYALDFCDQTDTLPDDARFRWSCETSWAVREYLKTRPASQVERLKRRVAEGRIELTGLFLNSSDLADEATIAATLQPIRDFRAMGFPVKTAMQDDINGVPWCLVDYLSGAGVEYLNMGQNDTRALKPFDRPVTFWWESPSGNRLLVNRPEHYMFGNSLGILSTRETFAKALFRHLQEISGKGYPFSEYAIQFSGYLTDNSPPSTTACKLVEEWNKTYAWPRLRLATISEFLKIMKSDHPGELPVVRGAWPDWWMDGFGSAAIQTAYARSAHSDCIANQGLMAISAIMGIKPNEHIRELQQQIGDDLAFYDEHTFGAAESITDPLCENSVVQLGEKESFVWSAVKKNRILREEVMGRVQPLLPKAAVPVITLFNTLNWRRSGSTLVYIDHQILPADKKFRIVDRGGQEVKVQPVASREEGTYWMMEVQDVPPLGYATYRIESETAANLSAIASSTVAAESGAGSASFSGIFENNYYRLEIDVKSGKITRFYDKAWHRELTDRGAVYSPGEFIYERLGKNRGQLEQYKLDEFTRKTWNDVRVGSYTKGQVWQSILLTGQVAGCAGEPGIRCEIRLYNNEKRVEFCYSMKKLAVTDPEGVYIAFPFTLPNSHHVVEVSGGTMVAGKEQIAGSASDWNGIQDYVSLRSDSGQIVFVSPEIPLVQLGDLNLGKFARVGTPEPPAAAGGTKPYPASGAIFSWVLNNYWTTNFLASQEGELKWSYQVTSGADPSNTLAARFGMENRVPLLNRVFPASAKPDTSHLPDSFFAGNNGSLVLVSARPSADGGGVVLQVRETSGKADSLTVWDAASSGGTLAQATRAKSVAEVNVLEEMARVVWPLQQSVTGTYSPARIGFRPFETKFILVRL
ncbi:MAG: glycoside hydrolase family 38 C-terminal domain-containing protein [Bacteroidota bacterium]